MPIRKFLPLIPVAAILLAAGCSQTTNTPVVTARHAPNMPTQQAPTDTPPSPTPTRSIPSSPPRSVPPVPPTQPTSQATIPAINPAATQKEIASHETQFNTNEKSRNKNISLAAKAIHGQVVQPGEVFSYNQTVGPTNEKRGYEKSTVYVEGEKKQGVGGGVCQVSTTLFNAAQEAGMTILERHDHSRPVTYAQSGKEAATSYGGIDFKFKNEKPYPVVIHAAVKDGEVEVAIMWK